MDEYGVELFLVSSDYKANFHVEHTFTHQDSRTTFYKVYQFKIKLSNDVFFLKRDDHSMWERRSIELLEREKKLIRQGLMMC